MLGVVALLCLLPLCIVAWLLVVDPNGRWHFISRPPLPPHAIRLETLFPSNEIERITTFEIEQPATAVREFYRMELGKQGWQYRCTFAADSGRCVPSELRQGDDNERVDVYERADRTLQVHVFPDVVAGAIPTAPDGYRLVWVDEWLPNTYRVVATGD